MEYYKLDTDKYKLIENKLYYLIMLLVFLGITTYFIYTGERTNDSTSAPYWIFSLFPSLVFLYYLGNNIQFNYKEKTLEVTFFGILIEKHDLQQFHNFLIINHKKYFINTGKEVKCFFLKKIMLKKK